VGLEVLEQMPDADLVVVPIGGGGLIAGIASAVRLFGRHEKYEKYETHAGHERHEGGGARHLVRVVGVEPEGAAVMRQSLDAGRAVRMPVPPKTIADGLAAPFAGEFCYGIVRELVDDVVLVTDDEIAAAMSLLLTRAKILAEPAGAAALAALLSGKVPAAAGAKAVAIVSGGNVDLDRLKSLI
jgi:threonine dehydratase